MHALRHGGAVAPFGGKRMRSYRLLAAALAVSAAAAFAETPAPDAAADGGTATEELVRSLHFVGGEVAIASAHAKLALTPEFRFLDAADAQRVLEQLWGNPPDADVLGMLVPTAASLTDSEQSWAVVVTYSDDGHVTDASAASIDFGKLLAQMQDDTREANAERREHGYAEATLIGWATPPRYDPATNKLYWAKEIAFAGNDEHTLNYDIRVLGRSGYLSLNAVAGMHQLETVQAEMPKVLAMTSFEPGSSYADFDEKTDEIAAYGIAALVTGTLAAKAGLFAKLLALVIAFKKVLIAAVVAAAAAMRKRFARRPG